ncbi:type II secretion system F family protein [Escherichia coli]|uniref:type II secretion system F family protein n=1 Tax=Escherichia coli TaxID=562 RepID=UPI000B429B7A|nr:type II secretion system F family protein [Escherichia coli]MBB7002849.1 type II secretion system F family protein [Escherichia coli]MCE0533543.1 type II secretion system F family protein [Escherichia coli]MCE0552703.1 type II secretion system F family protein [Escherichia coli]OWC70010.1 type II secretion protein F [Escherichia coli]QXN18652.1 type II secretion system F family protein [Escherichia coli]
MKKFNKKQRVYLYQFCSDMLHSGLPIYDSINKLRSEGESLLGKSFIKKLDILMNRMKSSPSVSASFESLIPMEELSAITAAENSGSLAEGFSSMVLTLNYQQKLKSQLIKSVTFPSIMMVLALIVIAGYAVKVFPAFEKVVAVSRWPGVTQSLYQFGTALYNGLWITILVVFTLSVIFIRFIMFNFHGDIRNRFLDRIVPFSIYKKLVASVLLNDLSLMIKNRIPLANCLVIMEKNANRWLKSHIRKMQDNMAKGLGYGDAFKTGLLGGDELLNISLYSGMPYFDQVLGTVSEKAKEKIEQNIQSLAGMLKSMSTLVLGGCVVWVFIALFALSDQLSKMTG